jgi:hypothetical protein
MCIQVMPILGVTLAATYSDCDVMVLSLTLSFQANASIIP